MARLEIRLLGSFQAALDGLSISGFESSKVRALLAYLAAESKRPHPRESLAGLLWPDWPQPSAMSNLRYALADLRKNIADRQADPPFLLISREAIQLNPEADCWVDVGEFEKLSAVSIQQPPERSSGAIENLKSAIDLYQGEFLEGFSLADSPAFEEWILAKREYYRRQAMKALHTLTDTYGQGGEYETALSYARHQLELEPWQEEAHQQVMRLLALNRQRSAALAQYEACRDLLAKGLGVEPGEETVRLYEAIRDGILETGPGVTRLEPLIQALPRPKHNLPLQLTSFIGREKEIAEVQALIHRTQGRLVTLTGTGGVGKTRLALQVAASLLESFPDGAWLVELARLADPDRVPSAAAATLDVHETPGRPAAVALGDYLRLKHLLLILDNCEHLAAACAGLAASLLQSCPQLFILATSRELLGVDGETTFYVPSLSTPGAHERPDLEVVSQYEAVRLFVERAQSTSPAFIFTEENAPAVAQICQRLDGIPLAIELAAARLRLLSVGQIASRLNDAFRMLTGGSRTALPRHQTLRALIDWSYQLLTADEKNLLRTLSVFAGGWTLEAAEAVSPDCNVLDWLGQLLDKSLVNPVISDDGINRYRMLETIRQYAQEKLVDCGEAGLARQRHLAYFLGLAERIEPELRGRTQKARLNQLEEELDNLRLALGWALQTDPETELRLASAMMYFWHIHTRKLEGLEWLEQGLAGAQAPGAPPIRLAVRAKALASSGIMHSMENMLVQSTAELEESLRIYLELGTQEKAGLASTLGWLGSNKAFTDEKSQAIALLRESLALSREIKDIFGAGECLLVFGEIYTQTDLGRDQGYLEARPLLQESLALFLEIGDPDGIATAYMFLGYVAYDNHEPEQAKFLLEQSLSYCQQAGNRESTSGKLCNLAGIAHVQGDDPAAIEYLLRSIAIGREIGNPRSLGKILEWMGWMGVLILSQGNHGLARRFLEEVLALCQTAGDQAGMAYAHLYLGKLAWMEGDAELAAQKLAEASAAGQEVNNPDLAAELLTLRSVLAWAGGDEKKAEVGLKEALRTAGRMKPWGWGGVGALNALAQLAARQHPERAARLFGAVEHLYWDYLYSLSPVERAGWETALAQVKAALGEQHMAELRAEGAAMTSEEAIAYALEEERGG